MSFHSIFLVTAPRGGQFLAISRSIYIHRGEKLDKLAHPS